MLKIFVRPVMGGFEPPPTPPPEYATGHRSKWCRNIAENFNRLSRAHERYRQTTDDEQCRLPLSPPKGDSKCKVSKIRTIGLICNDFETVREMMVINH